jgi:hypothetical protein
MVFFGIATEKLTQIKNGERNPPKCLKIFFNGALILSIDSRHRPLHDPYIGLFLFSHKHCVHFFVFSMRLPSPRAHPRPPPRSTLPSCRPPSLICRLPLLPPRPHLFFLPNRAAPTSSSTSPYPPLTPHGCQAPLLHHRFSIVC